MTNLLTSISPEHVWDSLSPIERKELLSREYGDRDDNWHSKLASMSSAKIKKTLTTDSWKGLVQTAIIPEARRHYGIRFSKNPVSRMPGSFWNTMSLKKRLEYLKMFNLPEGLKHEIASSSASYLRNKRPGIWTIISKKLYIKNPAKTYPNDSVKPGDAVYVDIDESQEDWGMNKKEYAKLLKHRGKIAKVLFRAVPEDDYWAVEFEDGYVLDSVSGYSLKKINPPIKKVWAVCGPVKESKLIDILWETTGAALANMYFPDAQARHLKIYPYSKRAEAERDAKNRLKERDREYAVGYINPVRKRNSKSTRIYDRILAIEARKGSRGAFPNQNFRHEFKGKATIEGLPDGSLLIKNKNPKKKLWRNFNYD